MNLVAFGLILICCHAWAIEIDEDFSVEEIFADTYKQTKLERILEDLKNTIDDPFVAESLPINFNDKFPSGQIILNALFTHVNVVGLSSYHVNSAGYNIVTKKANADLTWPLVVGSTNFNITHGSAYGYEVYGQGNANATVKNFNVHVDLHFKLKKFKYIQITKIATKISLGGLELYATGLYNDDEKSKAVCKKISDMAPNEIKDKQKKITDDINYFVLKYVNPILAKTKIIG